MIFNRKRYLFKFKNWITYPNILVNKLSRENRSESINYNIIEKEFIV